MTAAMTFGRRIFLADLGRAGFAVAVLGVAACAAPSGDPTPRGSAAGPSDGGATSPGAPIAGATGEASAPPPGAGSPAAGATTWRRVNLGFVSAYILARNGEGAAAMVRTLAGG